MHELKETQIRTLYAVLWKGLLVFAHYMQHFGRLAPSNLTKIVKIGLPNSNLSDVNALIQI